MTEDNELSIHRSRVVMNVQQREEYKDIITTVYDMDMNASTHNPSRPPPSTCMNTSDLYLSMYAGITDFDYSDVVHDILKETGKLSTYDVITPITLRDTLSRWHPVNTPDYYDNEVRIYHSELEACLEWLRFSTAHVHSNFIDALGSFVALAKVEVWNGLYFTDNKVYTRWFNTRYRDICKVEDALTWYKLNRESR